MVLGEDNAHGTSIVTTVGPPGGLDTVIVPSNAASRRSSPAARAGRRVGATAAVVATTTRSTPAAVVRDPTQRRSRAGVLADVGQALGDREVDGRLDRRRRPSVRSVVTVTGMAMSSASACTAPASPRSASTGGWMPRTTDRRSPRAAPVVARASRRICWAASGSRPSISSAMPRLMPSATSRACAPSCRSRSIRRSSVAEWSMRLRAGLGQRLDAPLQDLGVPVRQQPPVQRRPGRHDRPDPEPPQRPRHDQQEEQDDEQRQREADRGGHQ